MGEINVSTNGQEKAPNPSFSSMYSYILLDAYSIMFFGYIPEIFKNRKKHYL